MNPFFPAVTQLIGWSLLHFLWQGALLALSLKLLLFLLRNRSAQARYVAACGALALLALAPVITYRELSKASGSPTSLQPGSEEVHRTSLESGSSDSAAPVIIRVVAILKSPAASVRNWLQERLEWLVLAWACGVAAFGLRLAAGWWQIRRLASRGEGLNGSEWRACLNGAAGRLGVNRTVRLLQSALIQVPMTFGWLRPTILLPMGCLTGLTPQQLEAIIAHELAHIRRHDYLVNLAQTVVEMFLFYHPAVWWVSRQIRLEREHCCDDLVVSAWGDRIAYAQALASLEEWRNSPRQWALAATSAPLLHRIRRILGRPAESRLGGGWLVGTLAVLLVVILTGAQRNRLAAQTDSASPKTAPPREDAIRSAQPLVVTPSQIAAPSSTAVQPPPGAAQVTIDIRFTELGAPEMKQIGLANLLDSAGSGQTTQILITNRNGIVSPPALDEKGRQIGLLFDNPGLRNVELVNPGKALVLSSEQFRPLLDALRKQPGADVLSAPRVTTLSGHPARIEVSEIKQVVTGVSITTDAKNQTKASYIPSALSTGPAVDVLPLVLEDGRSIRLQVTPSWTEFLGYEESSAPILQESDGKAEPIQVQRPLPHFQVRQTHADTTVQDGQTIVIKGIGPLHDPAKGKSRTLGRFFRSEAKPKRELIVFVTPVITDSAGNRVHPEKEQKRSH